MSRFHAGQSAEGACHDGRRVGAVCRRRGPGVGSCSEDGGLYRLLIGFGNESAYEGAQNSVFLLLTSAKTGAPIARLNAESARQAAGMHASDTKAAPASAALAVGIAGLVAGAAGLGAGGMALARRRSRSQCAAAGSQHPVDVE